MPTGSDESGSAGSGAGEVTQPPGGPVKRGERGAAAQRASMRERAASARERAEAARQQALTARQRVEDLHRRVSAMGVGPIPLDSAPWAAAGERPADGGQPVHPMDRLMAEGERLRAEAAELSDCMADEAERFADQLEHNAARGDRETRLSLAETERRIARIERRNAERLRAEPGDRTPLESLPDLPGFSRIRAHSADPGQGGTDRNGGGAESAD